MEVRKLSRAAWRGRAAIKRSRRSALTEKFERYGQDKLKSWRGRDGLTSSPLYIVVKEAPRRVPLEAAVQKGAEASPVTLTPAREQLRLKTAPYINRAKDYRVQGNYAAALADLEKARRIDPASVEIANEIDQTKRACNAERKLGRKDLDC